MEFKKLSAVEAVEAVGDAAHVLIEENGVIKRAPKDEVGGIKIAAPAEVGQTIVVKAVDEAGVPTEWEAVEMSNDILIVCRSYSATPIYITTDSLFDILQDMYECKKFVNITVYEMNLENSIYQRQITGLYRYDSDEGYYYNLHLSGGYGISVLPDGLISFEDYG